MMMQPFEVGVQMAFGFFVGLLFIVLCLKIIDSIVGLCCAFRHDWGKR